MLSLVAEAREEIARQSVPKITPPTPETVDSLRALAGPFSQPQDPLVSGYADARAEQWASTPQWGAGTQAQLQTTAPTIDFSATRGDQPTRSYPYGFGNLSPVEQVEAGTYKPEVDFQPPTLYDIARTEIPYARQFARGAGDVAGELAKVSPQLGPANVIAEQAGLGDVKGADLTPANVASTAVESAVPVEVWQAALELLPGVGTVPDVVRMVKQGSPEAILAVRTALKDERLQPVIRKLVEERGASKIPGEIPEPKPGAEGANAIPASGDSLPSPSQATEGAVTGAPDALTPPESIPEPAPPASSPAGSGSGEPPTIREIEARSAPLTPEQRARLPRDQQEAIYVPRDFAEATADTARAGEGPIGGSLQKIQDVAQKVPLIRSLFSFAEPMAAARAQTKLGNLIPEAMVRRAVFIGDEQQKARAAFMGWLADSRATLDLDGKGIAWAVDVKPGAEIPASVRGRLDDIVEHPDDYALTAAQNKAITKIAHTFNAVTQHQLDAGVDVREVMNAYFPRVVKKSPKGTPKGNAMRLSSRPGHAKPRQFTDLREGAAAGYEYVNPVEAMQHRIDTGVESIGNRRTLEGIKELGQKPSERVPQTTRDAYLQAKAQYIGEKGQPSPKTPETAKALEGAKRDLRVAATKANDPHIGETKAFGRIFPEEVTSEIAKYVDVDDPGALDTFFRIQRATATSSDLSALLVQGGNLFYRNNIAWWKATGYSIASIAKEPVGYVSRNIDSIQRGIDAGAIKPPSEYLLREGGGAVQQVGKLPVVKQAQRSFEWFVFVGQSEWWKGAERMGMSTADKAELAAVIRKGTGSMLRPGLTKAQQQAEIGTFFAGKFLMAVNGLAADALRGGVRGAEARKTLGMVFGGATALTIGAQLATDGTMPNLTDPSNRDKQWLTVKRPGGNVNLFGPLYPYLKAYASIGQNLAQGKQSAAVDDALFLGRTRLSIQWGTLIDFIEGKDAVGNEIDRGDPKSVAGYFARRAAPIGPKQIAEGGIEGQREFPEGNLQVLGGRANQASEFRQKLNAGEKYLTDGNYSAAYKAATQADDMDAAEGIKYEWRKDFEKRGSPVGLTVTPGAYDEETGMARAPEIEIATVNDKWKQGGYGDVFASALKIPAAGSYNEQRSAFIEQHKADYMKSMSVTEPVAYDALVKQFDSAPIAKSYKTSEKRERLDFWRAHPDLLHEAWELGLEELNDDERKILSAQPSIP